MNADPFWMKGLLVIHIIAGFGSFLLAPVALVTAKGGKAHKRWGMVYLWCMGGVAVTAFPMALFRPVLFLALVAVFSFYAAFSGYRVLKLKDLPFGGKAKPIDWIAAAITFADGVLLAWLGAFHPGKIQVIGVVGVVFGLIAMQLALGQVKNFIFKPSPGNRMFWWHTHLSYFIGSYIAAWSAFSVVTLAGVFGNHWYIWLWPTIIGVPAIVITNGYYQRKFAPKSRPPAVPQPA